jgi:hypothetical protein
LSYAENFGFYLAAVALSNRDYFISGGAVGYKI